MAATFPHLEGKESMKTACLQRTCYSLFNKSAWADLEGNPFSDFLKNLYNQLSFKLHFSIGPRMPVTCCGYGVMLRSLSKTLFGPLFLNFLDLPFLRAQATFTDEFRPTISGKNLGTLYFFPTCLSWCSFPLPHPQYNVEFYSSNLAAIF